MSTGRRPPTSTLLKFAVFTAFTLVLTLVIAQQIIGTSFSSHYTLYSRFDNVQGLLKGDPVRIAGVPVGQVAGIKVVDGKASVTLAVDTDVHVPSDTAAEMRWRNVLGQRYVQLVPGGATTMLHGGDHITSTKSVVDLSAIVNDLGPLTSNFNPEQLNTVLTAFNQALAGNEGNVNGIISNLDGLLSTFAERKTAISSMVKNLQTLSGTIKTRDAQIATSVDNLSDLASYFAQNNTTLSNALATLSKSSGDLDAILGDNQAQLGDIVNNLTNLAGTFKININTLEKMVQGLPVTLRSLFSSGNGGNFLRTNIICISFVKGPCPFQENLPGLTDTHGESDSSATSASTEDLTKLAQMLTGRG